MPDSTNKTLEPSELFAQLEERGLDLDELPGVMFRNSVIYIDQSPGSEDMDLDFARQIVTFAGGRIVENLDDSNITQIVIGQDRSRLKQLRQAISRSAES